MVGSQVHDFVTVLKPDGKVLVEIHLSKERKRTIMCVEEVSLEDRTCRWIDSRLLLLGHFASLMRQVLETEYVELDHITVDALHGKYNSRALKGANYNEWVAYTHLILKFGGYKVFMGDTESDDILTSGIWPSHIPQFTYKET
ncbi:hypothetical protein R1sor_026911 [Riccia sorocarpa]|uniref:Uncharacterized protein n=1 Tax=Riccia sorocarpa TaxID=122646 RepID=A0ABD3GCQ2_9MARC